MALSKQTVQFWLNMSRYVSFFGFVSTFVLNVLLIILTNWYIKRKFGTYKHLIIIFSVIGIGFDSLEIIIWPMIQSVNYGFIYFSNCEIPYFSQNLLTHLLVLYSGSFYVSISFLAVMFIHRYFSVVKPEQLFYFQEKRITLWILYSFFIGCIIDFSVTYFGDMDDYTRQYMSDDIFNYYGKFVGDVPSKAVIVYDQNQNIRWHNIVAIMTCLLSVLLQNIIIVYCGYKIRSKLYSKNTSYSQSLRKLHSQFFKTLVFQVAAPTCLLFIPISTILYLPMVGIKINFPTGIVFGFFGLYPAIDSCLVMYIITDYKKSMRDFVCDIKKFFGCRKRRSYTSPEDQTTVQK